MQTKLDSSLTYVTFHVFFFGIQNEFDML